MWPLDHVGIAVRSIDEALLEYRNNFGFALDSREEVRSQGVEVAFIKLPNTLIELLAPLHEESTLAKFIQKRGPGLHHLCYRVDDIEHELARLLAAGVHLIDKIPRSGAHRTRIAFLHPKSTGGVLTELCEHPQQHEKR
jgi:methylmalonyl-CoA/ethylmalonyl-CoA epimerase